MGSSSPLPTAVEGIRRDVGFYEKRRIAEWNGEDELGRQDALQRLEKDNDVPLDFIAALLAEYGIDFSDLAKGLARWRKMNVRI